MGRRQAAHQAPKGNNVRPFFFFCLQFNSSFSQHIAPWWSGKVRAMLVLSSHLSSDWKRIERLGRVIESRLVSQSATKQSGEYQGKHTRHLETDRAHDKQQRATLPFAIVDACCKHLLSLVWLLWGGGRTKGRSFGWNSPSVQKSRLKGRSWNYM